jgi:hypothetical protein
VTSWKTVINWGFSYISGFYMSFALMELWDWFAVSAFHVEPIRYWNMYGLVILVRLFTPSINLVAIEKWEIAMKMIEACIPEDKRVATMAAIQRDGMGDNMQMLIANFMDIASSTISLAIGWAVHTFLM